MSHEHHTLHHQSVLVLENTFYIDPSKKEEFFQHFNGLREKVTAEPECLHWTVTESVSEPGCYHQSESWSKDAAWYRENQYTKSYLKEYLEAVEKYRTKPRVTIVGTRMVDQIYLKGVPFPEKK